MPYFVFRILPLGAVEPIADFPGFREAKSRAQQLRQGLPADGKTTVKVIFAENADAAADLITTPRQAPDDGDDY